MIKAISQHNREMYVRATEVTYYLYDDLLQRFIIH